MCSPLEMQFPVTNGCPDPANLCSCERSALVSRAAGRAGSSGADKHRSEALDAMLTGWASCLGLIMMPPSQTYQMYEVPNTFTAVLNNFIAFFPTPRT